MIGKTVEWTDFKNQPEKPKKKSKKNKSGKSGLVKMISVVFATAFFLGIMLFILVFIGLFGPVPSKQQLQDIKKPVASELN